MMLRTAVLLVCLAALPAASAHGAPEASPERARVIAAELPRLRTDFAAAPLVELGPEGALSREYLRRIRAYLPYIQSNMKDWGPEPGARYHKRDGSQEHDVRQNASVAFGLALLAGYSADQKSPAVQQSLADAKAIVRYLAVTHKANFLPTGGGTQWGDHWQSAWWAAKMALGAQLIWDRLSPEQRERVERVVTHEASRHLSRKAPGGSFRDTKSEENAWDTEVMAAAIALFPKHPKAPEWRAKLIEFDLNSLSTLDDQTSSAIVDGRPLKEQVYTENVHADYTIENHGAYHTCYMSCPLHSLAWGYYALTSAKQPVPEAQFHHFVDVWERMKPTFLDRRFAYVEGKDWPRYAYGMYFIMPALVTLQQQFGDQAAREIEKRRFRTFEEEQYSNGDGTFFGKRFTLNQMMHRLSEYELSLIHISEPTRLLSISYAVFCLKKKISPFYIHKK